MSSASSAQLTAAQNSGFSRKEPSFARYHSTLGVQTEGLQVVGQHLDDFPAIAVPLPQTTEIRSNLNAFFIFPKFQFRGDCRREFRSNLTQRSLKTSPQTTRIQLHGMVPAGVLDKMRILRGMCVFFHIRFPKAANARIRNLRFRKQTCPQNRRIADVCSLLPRLLSVLFDTVTGFQGVTDLCRKRKLPSRLRSDTSIRASGVLYSH